MGWIKLDRQIQDNFLWFDEPFTKAQAWIDLLLLANHEDGEIMVNGKYMKIKRGQHFTSTVKLAERWKWSRNKVNRFLSILCDSNMVKKRTGSGTLLTIVNYGKFQNRQTGNGTGHDTGDGAGDDTMVGTQTRSKRNKEDKNASSSFSNLSYAEERARQFALLEAWANEEDTDDEERTT